MYSSTCFGRPHAHHQELNNCSSSLRFYCWSVVVAVLLVVVGPVNRPHAHHQELNICSSSLRFYCWSVVIAVLLVVVGPVLTGPTTTNSTATTTLQQ
jgi:hypothetical protein